MCGKTRHPSDVSVVSGGGAIDGLARSAIAIGADSHGTTETFSLLAKIPRWNGFSGP